MVKAYRREETCVECGGRFYLFQLKPWSDGSPRAARSNDLHHMDPHGQFCTLRCAASYGVRARVRELG